MKLPSLKRILKEDVKGAPGWINPLLDTVNTFMEAVYQALNRNITFSQNVACTVKELDYQTPSSYPASVDSIEFMSGLKTKASGVMLMQVFDKADYTPPDGPVYVPWVENNGSIVIGTITGLEASKLYMVRLLVS